MTESVNETAIDETAGDVPCETGPVCGQKAKWIVNHTCGQGLLLCTRCMALTESIMTSPTWRPERNKCSCGAVAITWEDITVEPL